MDTVDANVSGLNSTNKVLDAGILTLGNTLRLMKNIMDVVADVRLIIADYFLFLDLLTWWACQ
jgi:hypothetical protein